MYICICVEREIEREREREIRIASPGRRWSTSRCRAGMRRRRAYDLI